MTGKPEVAPISVGGRAWPRQEDVKWRKQPLCETTRKAVVDADGRDGERLAGTPVKAPLSVHIQAKASWHADDPSTRRMPVHWSNTRPERCYRARHPADALSLTCPFHPRKMKGLITTTPMRDWHAGVCNHYAQPKTSSES